MDINVLFGSNVRLKRIQLGLSQERLAHMVGMDRTYLPSIEKGRRNVSLEIASRIAQQLKVPLCDLIK